MSDHETIISIIPAPAGLLAVYRPTPEGYTSEHREPVAALALIESFYLKKSIRQIVAMVIDAETGCLDEADNAVDFVKLEWSAPTKSCACSPT